MLAVLGISIEGEQAAADAFDELAARVQNKRDPLNTTAGILRSHLEAAYDTEGGLGGTGPWVPLTPRYGAWKAKHGPGVPLLVGLIPLEKGTVQDPTRPEVYAPSGAMRAAVLAPLQDKTTWQTTTSRLRYSVNSRIAIFHQTGTRKMAARPPVDPPAVFPSEVDATFTGWLNGLIDRAGL